jgi:hypothetical protein
VGGSGGEEEESTGIREEPKEVGVGWGGVGGVRGGGQRDTEEDDDKIGHCRKNKQREEASTMKADQRQKR